MSSLTRKKVSVHRGGRVYMRTMFVKSITHKPVTFALHSNNLHSGEKVSLGQFLRRHGGTYAGMNFGTGVLGGGGAAAGAHLGHKVGKFNHGLVGGWALGTGIGVRNQYKLATQTEAGRALVQDHNRMGRLARTGAHIYGAAFQLAGNAAGFYGANRLIRRGK